jgi:cell division protein FtsI (penicillin-binding protein 3)
VVRPRDARPGDRRRPDHRDQAPTTGPHPRLPQDAYPLRDRRATQNPKNPKNPKNPQDSRPTRAARPAQAPRPPRKPPRRPPGRLSIRRGEPGRRVGITLLAIAIVLTLFAGRLVQIQGMESGYYKLKANQEKLTPIALPALRGTIYGSNGQILAMTIETFTYTADPTQIPAAGQPAVARELAGPLGLTAATIANLLRHPTSKKYVVLAKGVSSASEAKIAALDIVGIYESPVYSRAYPDGEATANVVGFTNVNQNTGVLAGQAGIEEEYNKQLTGKAGSELVEMGADGQPIPLAGAQDTPAQNGESIRLTIDPDLQFSAMQACAAEVKKAKAKQCTAVIIQPATGDILAMAQWPTYDQSTNPQDATDLDVQDVFTPGSTAKVITASAALEHGGKTTMSAYNIPYVLYRGGQAIHDAEWSPGERYTIAGIIANSSNVGMSQVVASVSPPLQYEYLRNFGLDEPTGLNLPGESQGLLQPPSQWSADERYTLAYGQGIAVNAVPWPGAAPADRRHLQRGRAVHAGPAVEVHPGDRGQDGQGADPDPPAGARGGPGGGPAVGDHPRLRGRRQDRHRGRARPGGREDLPRRQPALRLRRELHRHGAGQRPQGRRGDQRAGPGQGERELFRGRGGGPGLLQRDEERAGHPADPAAAWPRATVCSAQCALILDTLRA